MPDPLDVPRSDREAGTLGSSPGRDSSFPATQWSVVLRAGAKTDSHASAALEALCRRYWYPLYTYVRRQGHTHHEAEECTQEFILQLLSGDGLQRARPERGRFRTFLLAGLRHFLTDAWRRKHTVKRGGGLLPISFSAGGDDSISPQPLDPALTPEQAFDCAWALGMIDQAVAGLRREYQTSRRAKIFEALAPLLWGAESTDSLAERAVGAGLSPNAFVVALHRGRRRLGDRLRALIADTVADPAEVDTEVRHLVAAISQTTSRG